MTWEIAFGIYFFITSVFVMVGASFCDKDEYILPIIFWPLIPLAAIYVIIVIRHNKKKGI